MDNERLFEAISRVDKKSIVGGRINWSSFGIAWIRDGTALVALKRTQEGSTCTALKKGVTGGTNLKTGLHLGGTGT